METGRSEPPPPTLSAAPNKSILKTFLFLPAVSNRFHPRQRPSIRLKNYLIGGSTRAAIFTAIPTVTKKRGFHGPRVFRPHPPRGPLDRWKFLQLACRWR